MKPAQRNRFVGKSKVLYIHKDGERLAVSNTHWLITGNQAEAFIEGIIPSRSLPNGKHAVRKSGRSWEFEEGHGPDSFRLIDGIKCETMQAVHSTGLYVPLGKKPEDCAILRTEEDELFFANRVYWDCLIDLYPTAQVRKEDGARATITFEVAGNPVAILMPIKPHQTPLPIQWIETLISAQDAENKRQEDAA